MTHPDPKKQMAYYNFLVANNHEATGNDFTLLFNYFRPLPENITCEWLIDNWGTTKEAHKLLITDSGDGEEHTNIEICFQTAWCPPEKLYEFLNAEGWKITAYYYEDGECFCGKWTSEEGDDWYDYDIAHPSTYRVIPRDIRDFACIADARASFLEDRDEDDDWSESESESDSDSDSDSDSEDEAITPTTKIIMEETKTRFQFGADYNKPYELKNKWKNYAIENSDKYDENWFALITTPKIEKRINWVHIINELKPKQT
jgi:hypothetical protein